MNNLRLKQLERWRKYSTKYYSEHKKRSHRYGRNGRLKVYVPVSEPERPIWDNIQRKLNTFNNDVIELQNRFFK